MGRRGRGAGLGAGNNVGSLEIQSMEILCGRDMVSVVQMRMRLNKSRKRKM